MAKKKKTVRKKAAKKKAVKRKTIKKKTIKRKTVKRKAAKKKTVKKTAKRQKSAKTQDAQSSDDAASLAGRRRALRRRRRTLRMKKAGTSITDVGMVAGTASRSTLLTRTRIIRKREDIGILPIDKNVMIKELIQAGSITKLATRFGVTKQAIGSWFGRRGLQAVDVAGEHATHKKEIM